MLPKAVFPAPFFKQMEKIELLKLEMEEKLLNENSVLFETWVTLHTGHIGYTSK
jgi:hypothetical protein